MVFYRVIATIRIIWYTTDLCLQRYEGNFNLYVKTRDLIKQEGIIFRHLLRLILLCGEFAQVTPVGMEPEAWKTELRELTDRLTASCRAVDPASTDEVIQMAKAADVVAGEPAETTPPPPKEETEVAADFAAGIFD